MTPRLVFLVALATVACGSSTADVSNPQPSAAPPSLGGDLCQGLVQDKTAHPMTALAKPALGQTVTDPQFATTIRRITAVTVSGSNPVIKPMYSTISAWNADESKMILYKVGSGHQLYDGRTYAYIRDLDIDPADIEQVYWHAADPDVFFYVSNKTLIRYHVSTGAKDNVRTFSFCSDGASGGDDPMFMSWDSNRIGLSCGSTVFVYEISTNTVLGQKSSPDTPQASPSGTLTFLGGLVTDAALNTLRTLDLDDPGSHASLGRYSNGNDTYNAVTFDPGPKGSGVGTLVTFDMTTGAGKVVVGPSTGYPYPPSGTHVSALAYKQPGWVFLSVVGDPSGQGVLDNELLIADTNSGKVCRIAHHRSYGKNNTKLDDAYWAEPHVVPSPSGTRALFGSDWGDGPSVDTYVVELPGYKASTAEAGAGGPRALSRSGAPGGSSGACAVPGPPRARVIQRTCARDHGFTRGSRLACRAPRSVVGAGVREAARRGGEQETVLPEVHPCADPSIGRCPFVSSPSWSPRVQVARPTLRTPNPALPFRAWASTSARVSFRTRRPIR